MRLPCLPRLPSLFDKLFIYIISTTFIKVMASMARGVFLREFIGSAPAVVRGKTWQCWQDSSAQIMSIPPRLVLPLLNRPSQWCTDTPSRTLFGLSLDPAGHGRALAHHGRFDDLSGRLGIV